jgi:hypothetical protein
MQAQLAMHRCRLISIRQTPVKTMARMRPRSAVAVAARAVAAVVMRLRKILRCEVRDGW